MTYGFFFYTNIVNCFQRHRHFNQFLLVSFCHLGSSDFDSNFLTSKFMLVVEKSISIFSKGFLTYLAGNGFSSSTSTIARMYLDGVSCATFFPVIISFLETVIISAPFCLPFASIKKMSFVLGSTLSISHP